MTAITIKTIADDDLGTIRAICDAESGEILYTAAEGARV